MTVHPSRVPEPTMPAAKALPMMLSKQLKIAPEINRHI
jgi:hypothetical protein